MGVRDVRLPWNQHTTLARRAEPLLAVAAATWGDLDRRLAALYMQGAVVELLQADDEVELYTDELPVDVAAARALVGAAPQSQSGPHRDRVEELTPWVPDTDYLPLGWFVQAVPRYLESWVWRHGVPATVVTRRRGLILAVENGLFDALNDVTKPTFARFTAAEMCQALRRLSPDTGLPLLLAERLGARHGRPVGVVADVVGVSPSAVEKWRSGLSLPAPERWRPLSSALGVPVAAVAAAARDRVPDGWDLPTVDHR